MDRKWTSRRHAHPEEIDAGLRLGFLDAFAAEEPEFWATLHHEAKPALGGGDVAAALELWAERFNLNVQWVRDVAFDVLRGLPATSVSPLRPAEESPLRGLLGVKTPAINWDPKSESEDEFRERVERYIGARHGEAEAGGAEQDGADPENVERDLRRLVKWFRGASFADIARQERPHADPLRDEQHRNLASDVGKLVRRLHARLGLPPRAQGA